MIKKSYGSTNEENKDVGSIFNNAKNISYSVYLKLMILIYGIYSYTADYKSDIYWGISAFYLTAEQMYEGMTTNSSETCHIESYVDDMDIRKYFIMAGAFTMVAVVFSTILYVWYAWKSEQYFQPRLLHDDGIMWSPSFSGHIEVAAYEKIIPINMKLSKWKEEIESFQDKAKWPENMRSLTSFQMKKVILFSFFKYLRFRFIQIVSKIAWPLFILLPTHYEYETTTTPANLTPSNSQLIYIWGTLKKIEAGLENPVQILIHLWMLLPIYPILCCLSWSEIIIRSFYGCRNIFTFGYYPVSFIDLSMGKITYAIINMALTQAMLRVGKPGLNMKKQILSILVMFISMVCQILSKVYAITFLYNLKVQGFLKYPVYIILTTLIIFLMNSLTTTKRPKKKIDWRSKIKIVGWNILAALCSIITKIDFTKSSAPSLISHILYQTFQLVVCLLLILLPTMFPNLFYNIECYRYPLLKNIFLWLTANIFQV